VILNVVGGIVGTLLSNWLISHLMGVGTINQGELSIIPAMLVLPVCMVILLTIVNLLRRGRPR